MMIPHRPVLVAHDPYNPPTLAVRAVDPSFVVLAGLAPLCAQISRRPELERHAPRAVALREACPVGALLLIDIGTVYKDRITPL